MGKIIMSPEIYLIFKNRSIFPKRLQFIIVILRSFDLTIGHMHVKFRAERLTLTSS